MAKIVVIGGSGLIGSKVVAKLTEHGHEAVPASPNSGVNTITGEGLAQVLQGADVVVDVSNSPSFAPDDVMEFFTTSTRNLISGAREAGVGHYVALTVVGTDRPNTIAYFAAKSAQENLIRESGIPYSLVHATQFFEFISGIAAVSGKDEAIHLPNNLVQPIAAEDVATAVARAAAGEPLGTDIEIAGPEVMGLDEMVRRGLTFRGDARAVTTDPEAPYFGARMEERTLMPAEGVQVFPTTLAEWLPANPPRG